MNNERNDDEWSVYDTDPDVYEIEPTLVMTRAQIEEALAAAAGGRDD